MSFKVHSASAMGQMSLKIILIESSQHQSHMVNILKITPSYDPIPTSHPSDLI
ncbi:hypothetical protein [Acinetobacter sp.]|uniref:hypothetical protein n=1 Tax=Acinetobacter sp. TaxID=472 RepID=UPI0025C52B7E|nr:hypothetical protein [Acinetobacter sp.]